LSDLTKQNRPKVYKTLYTIESAVSLFNVADFVAAFRASQINKISLYRSPQRYFIVERDMIRVM